MRLFFLYNSAARIIIHAGVNDENSFLTYRSKTDAYAVFRAMLNKGDPPDDWDELAKAAGSRSATKRLAAQCRAN